MSFLWALFFSFILSLIFTPVFGWVAKKYNIIDKPDASRKKHGRIVPYFGGLSLMFVFLVSSTIFLTIDSRMLVIIVGLLFVGLLGFMDDVYDIKPWQKLIGQLLIGVYLFLFGVGISFLNLPFGEVFDFSSYDYNMIVAGFDLNLNIFTAFITIFWTVLLMNSINFLDGMDGLAGGVSMIAFLIIFFLSVTSYVNQFDSAMIAIILTGALMGFLVYNLPKASIFMGDIGSLMLGYMLAVMAIISGSKLATVILVLGVVLLDVMFVIWSRMRHGNKIWKADLSHLHHKLLARGWSQWRILALYYSSSIVLGVLALFVPNSLGKIIIGLIVFSLFGLFVLRSLETNKK